MPSPTLHLDDMFTAGGGFPTRGAVNFAVGQVGNGWADPSGTWQLESASPVNKLKWTVTEGTFVDDWLLWGDGVVGPSQLVAGWYRTDDPSTGPASMALRAMYSPATTLNSGGTLASGAAVVPFLSTTGYRVGQLFGIDSGNNYRVHKIAAIDGSNNVTLAALNIPRPNGTSSIGAGFGATDIAHANGVAITSHYGLMTGLVNTGNLASIGLALRINGVQYDMEPFGIGGVSPVKWVHPGTLMIFMAAIWDVGAATLLRTRWMRADAPGNALLDRTYDGSTGLIHDNLTDNPVADYLISNGLNYSAWTPGTSAPVATTAALNALNGAPAGAVALLPRGFNSGTATKMALRFQARSLASGVPTFDPTLFTQAGDTVRTPAALRAPRIFPVVGRPVITPTTIQLQPVAGTGAVGAATYAAEAQTPPPADGSAAGAGAAGAIADPSQPFTVTGLTADTLYALRTALTDPGVAAPNVIHSPPLFLATTKAGTAWIGAGFVGSGRMVGVPSDGTAHPMRRVVDNLANLIGNRTGVGTVVPGYQAVGFSRITDWWDIIGGLPQANLTAAVGAFATAFAGMGGQQKFVFVGFGVEDAAGSATPTTTFRACLDAITGYLQAAGYTVVLCDPAYVIPSAQPGGSALHSLADVQRLADLAGVYASVAAGRFALTCAPNTWGISGNQAPSWLAGDGISLTRYGAEAMARVWAAPVYERISRPTVVSYRAAAAITRGRG